MARQRHPTLTLSFEDRSSFPDLHPLASHLFRLMTIKQSNLCVSADVSSASELLHLAEEVGDSICMFKTHADIVHDFTDRTYLRLREVALRKHFFIFEDRKFGDIGSTVQRQYVAGPYMISRWAHLVNAHIFPGPAIVTALKQAADSALQAYNSMVATEISASSPQTSADSSSEGDVGAEAARRLASLGLGEEAIDGEEESEGDDEDGEDDDDEKEEGADGNRGGTSLGPPRFYQQQPRKPSIVAIRTTIESRTELVSPLPSSAIDVPLKRLGEDTAVALERLGPPPLQRGLLLLAEMSSQGHLMTKEYTQRCVEIARANQDFVIGFIAQRGLNEVKGDNFLTLTPGVQLEGKGDALGQQYNTPQKVVTEMGSDVIIVGRGILNAEDRAAEAEKYRKEGWKAYEARLRSDRRA